MLHFRRLFKRRSEAIASVSLSLCVYVCSGGGLIKEI